MKHLLLFLLATITLFSCKNREELEADYKKDVRKYGSEEAKKSILNDSISKAQRDATTTNRSKDIEKLSTAEAIAYASGLENWSKVTELKFTFNVEAGKKTVERKWTWRPKDNEVSFQKKDSIVTYNRSNITEELEKTDATFINDRYWLHAPFNLVWDDGTTISENQKKVAPISKDSLRQITVTYNDSLGYTPGDAYDFYYDADFMVREWVYRKGNAEKPSMVTTWEDYKNFNGLTFATMHKDSTANLKLFFTDISVKKESEAKGKSNMDGERKTK